MPDSTSALSPSAVGLGNVNNTSDANKPVSGAQATALALKAPVASPAFTGTPTGITAAHVGAYTSAQTDALIAIVQGGVSAKPNVQAATVSSIATLAAVTLASVFSGYTPVATDRVLVKDSASPDGVVAVSAIYNGWYVVGTVTAGIAALTRAPDANASAEFVGVTTCIVARGSLAGKQYSATAADSFALGTDTISYVEIPNVAAVLTTRGDLLRRGASVPERFPASTLDTFVGGDGTDVGVRTAAQVKTSLGIGAVTATGADANAARGAISVNRYGNQTGGDATWSGWTLAAGAAVNGGALRLTAAAFPGTTNAGTSLPLAGRAAPRALRLEWLLKPVSGWSTNAAILYLGVARGTGLTQDWDARCSGDASIGVWAAQPAANLQPGVSVAAVGPTIATSTTWLAVEIGGGRVQYFYGTGTGTGGRTPPAPSEWKLFADYLASTYSGLSSPLGETLVQPFLQGESTTGTVLDLDSLTLIALSPVAS